MSADGPHPPARSLNTLAFSATVHCLTGCAIGEVLGMVIGTAVGFSNLVTIVLSIVLAFASDTISITTITPELSRRARSRTAQNHARSATTLA